jgi:acyl-CoA thioester hydrolase|tara:strand:+ start:585 stop:1001 length:417 start_codon:yes stop_codon:yes gene_type:complete
MSKVHKCKDLNIFVYVEDTDFQGIVYHANYLKYFERARSSCLRDLYISQSKQIEEGKVFIIKSINIEFLRPAKIEDDLVVSSEIEYSSDARLFFHQQIKRNESNDIICRGKVEVCFYDQNKNRPVAFPEKLLKVFKYE